MNNIIQTIQHTARAAAVLLIALLAAQTAGAEDIATYYLDKDGTRHDVSATVLMGTENSLGYNGQTTWYVVNSNIQYTNVTIRCYGDINLILADGKTMTANNSNGNAISGPFGSLTIYGQTLGTGTLDATGDISYSGGDIIINGGIVKATSTGSSAISSSENLTINGGTVDAKGKYGLSAGNVTINGGNVTATGGDYGQGISANAEGTITINGGIVDAKGGSGLYAPNIAINGGKVTATGYDSGIWAYNGTITLGWTRASDFIQANSYSGTVNVKGSLAFLTDDATPVTISGSNIAPASISGRKLTPVLSSALAQDGDTYTIKNTTGWGLFCDMQEGGETFSGKTIVLAGDIGTPEDPVTRMGSSTTQFRGTFDGQGHTLTVQYGTPSEPVKQQFVAPFPNVTGGATFRRLTIAGSIYSGYATEGDKGTGGLIGCLFGGVTVEHCVSTVTVNAASDRAGGFVGHCEHAVTFTDCVSSAIVTCTGSGSGFVGWSRASDYTIAFYGCLFDGKVLKQGTVGSGNGSFVGWKGSSKTVTITNCIAAPAADANMATYNSATFCRYSADTTKDNGETHITNCYYTQTLGTAQGKALHTVTAGTDVTVAHAGVATHYATSGITAYKATGASADSDPFIAGLLYNNNVLYAGSGDVVSLTLSNTAPGDVPDGYQYAGYTTNAGTLNGNTLTMPAADVTVSPALRSTHAAVPVSYLDAGGTPQTAQAIALDGTETDLTAGWYFVGRPTVAFDHTLDLYGNVHLILADGCTMNVTSSDYYGIDVYGTLTIYGQYNGTGTVTATGTDGYGIYTYSGTITISGGTVTANSDNNYGIYTDRGTITISGGTVNATGDNNGIYTDSGTITISGGRVTATGEKGAGILSYIGTITLGCTNASDFIYASSYYVGTQGKLNIADGQTLIDEDGYPYSGNGVTIPAGKTLQPSVFDLTANQAPDGNYWTTYYNGTTGFTIDADENACAYTATYGGDKLTLKKLGKEIPAGTAVIIVADNDVVSMTATDLPAYSGDTNDLRGVNVDTQTSALGDGTFYVLGMTTVNDEQHFGFHRYTGSTMAAHKAFVLVSGSQAAARSLTMVFDEATGIVSAEANSSLFTLHSSLSTWFTLDGRRLQGQPTAPGIYVNNGKKVVIK